MSVTKEYRHFYRLLLWFGPQQRAPLRGYLRRKFKESNQVEPAVLAKTVEFVDAAARREGLERRIMSGLAEHLASKHKLRNRKQVAKKLLPYVEFNEAYYQHMLDGLNKTMGLCL